MGKWTRQQIVDLLQRMDDTGDRAVCRAVVAIYNRQTSQEQQAGATIVHNNIGFNGADSSILSSFAEQIRRKAGRPGCPLSMKQLMTARKLIVKYSRQLADIANNGGN